LQVISHAAIRVDEEAPVAARDVFARERAILPPAALRHSVGPEEEDIVVL